MSLEAQRKARLEDPGAEFLDRMTSLWDRFGRQALVALGVVVAAGVVTFFVLRSRQTTEEQAAGQLAEATIYYFQGDLPRAQQMAKQVADQYPSTASGNDAHRLMGDAAFWSNDHKTAVAEYRRYLSRQKTGMLADAVNRSLAYALENNGEYAEAAKLFDALVGKLDRESSAEFLAAASRNLRLAGNREEARKRLERLVAEFGDTSYARLARMEASELAATP